VALFVLTRFRAGNGGPGLARSGRSSTAASGRWFSLNDPAHPEPRMLEDDEVIELGRASAVLSW